MLFSRQTFTLLMVVFFAFVGLSLPYPILAPLFLHPDSTLFQGTHFPEQYRAILLGFTLAAYPLAQFFGSPILGSLSDKWGRKKLLIITIIGTGIGYLLSGFAILHNTIGLLIISRILTGFLEGNMGIAQASIADMGMDKYKGLGAISAFSSLGYLFGPLIGGLLCDAELQSWFDYTVPFFFGSIMALFIVFFVIFFFNETKSNTISHKKISVIKEMNILSKIKAVFRKPSLRNAFIVMTLLSLSIDCYYEFYPAFLVYKWQMTPKLIAIYSVLLCIGLFIGSYILPIYLKRKQNPLIYRGRLLLFFIVSLVTLLFATNVFTINAHFFLVGLIYATINTIQSVAISDAANQNEQGEIMGLQWGLRMLGDGILCIFGSLLLAYSYIFPIILSVLLATICAIVGRTELPKEGIYTKLKPS